MEPGLRRKIRLEPGIYRIPGLPCSVTMATKDRRRLFGDERLANDFVSVVKTVSHEDDIPLYAYCVMPDHVHLLVSASERKDIIGFVREIKSRGTRMARRHGYPGAIWQRSFYDHFLREDEDCRIVAEYIIHNPVRNGMVEIWTEYPFCGSLVYDL